MVFVRTLRPWLMACSSMICLAPGALQAAESDTSKSKPIAHQGAHHSAAAPKASTTPTVADSGGITGMAELGGENASEKITVSGRTISANGVTNTTPGGGLMPAERAPRSQSGVTRDYIAKQSPTTSIANLVANLPGAVSARTDPLGMTGSGDVLSMRGLNQSQIGFMLEGAPESDPINYQPFTSTLVDAENLGSVTVSQGSPDIEAPLINAVGGQISSYEIDPSHKMGGFVDFLGGTHSANKEFIRFNTGDIGNTGIRGFMSFSHTSANNWRGAGKQFRYHMDAKFVKEWGMDNSAKLIVGYTRSYANGMLNPTMAQWKQYGTGYNLNKNYTPGDLQYYKLNVSNSDLINVVAPMHFTLTNKLQLNLTPYYVQQYAPTSYGGETIPISGGNYGGLTYGTPGSPYPALSSLPYQYNSGGSNVVTTVLDDPWHQKNGAINGNLKWSTKHNTVIFGAWYSYTAHAELYQYDVVNFSGGILRRGANGPVRFPNGDVLSGDNLNFWQQQVALYLADTVKLLNDKLEISAGLKTVMMYREGTNNIPAVDGWKRGQNYFEPLPQFYASYFLDEHNQVYINGTTSFRAPVSTESLVSDYDPNATSTGGIIAHGGNLKPEYSIGEEIGFRHTGLYNLSVSAFNINITNHNISSSGYIPGSTQVVAEPINAGGETTRGFQGEFGLRPWHHFSPYVSAQYVYSTMDNNFNTGTDVLNTAGKFSVNTPRWTTSLGLSYDDGSFFGMFNLRYVGAEYTTLMNDERMPGYVAGDLTLGYRMKSVGPAKHPQIQLNLVNIGDNHYLSTAASTTANARDTIGMHGTLVSGSSPTYYLGAPFAALVSISCGL